MTDLWFFSRGFHSNKQVSNQLSAVTTRCNSSRPFDWHSGYLHYTQHTTIFWCAVKNKKSKRNLSPKSYRYEPRKKPTLWKTMIKNLSIIWNLGYLNDSPLNGIFVFKGKFTVLKLVWSAMTGKIYLPV